MRIKCTTCLALGLCMLMASCSTRQPVGAVRNGMLGSWKHVRNLEEKKPSNLTEHVLDIVDDMTIPAPYPDRLVFRADGTYEATYSGKQLDGIRRRRESPDLPDTLKGRYEVSVDWSGLTWIEMDNGVPERRITLGRNTLTLHKARAQVEIPG